MVDSIECLITQIRKEKTYMKELISMSLEELQLALKKAEAMEIFTASIVLDAE